MVDGLLHIRGSCSQGTLPDKGLHLHDSAPDLAITSDLAQWQLWRVRKTGLRVGSSLPRSSTLPLQVPCQRLLGQLRLHWASRWSWSGLRCLGSPPELFASGSLVFVTQKAAASRCSILAGIPGPQSQQDHCTDSNHPRAQAVE